MTDNPTPEPTVQVPVKSIEDELEYRVRTVLARVRMAEKHDEPYPREWVNNEIGAGRERIRALLSQPTPSAEPCPVAVEHAPHEWDVNEGEVGFGSRCPGVTDPPRIKDMAPGTTFDMPVRWEVGKPGAFTGRPIAHMIGDGPGRYLDAIDPSTIRNVTVPADAS